MQSRRYFGQINKKINEFLSSFSFTVNEIKTNKVWFESWIDKCAHDTCPYDTLCEQMQLRYAQNDLTRGILICELDFIPLHPVLSCCHCNSSLNAALQPSLAAEFHKEEKNSF